jgi:hypothetical protein
MAKWPSEAQVSRTTWRALFDEYTAIALRARRRLVRALRADGGRQVKRRVGPMRVEGSRNGLTRSQAEAELRRLIAETKPARIVAGDALTMAELGRRYLANLERQSRKKATTTAVRVDPARLA